MSKNTQLTNFPEKLVYNFGDGKAEGSASMKNLLGGKGANLAEMSLLGLPVPLGFTITTEVCDIYYKNNREFPTELKIAVAESLKIIEKNLTQFTTGGKREAEIATPIKGPALP